MGDSERGRGALMLPNTKSKYFTKIRSNNANGVLPPLDALQQTNKQTNTYVYSWTTISTPHHKVYVDTLLDDFEPFICINENKSDFNDVVGLFDVVFYGAMSCKKTITLMSSLLNIYIFFFKKTNCIGDTMRWWSCGCHKISKAK